MHNICVQKTQTHEIIFFAQFPLLNHEMKSLWCMPSQAINVLILYTFISHWVGASLWKTILFKTHCFFATWFRMLIKFYFWVYIFLGTNVKVSNEFLILGWELILMLMQKTMFCDISCTKRILNTCIGSSNI